MHHSTIHKLAEKFAAATDIKRPRNPNVMRVVMVSVVTLFIGGIGVSLMHQPDIFSNLDWRPVAILLAFCVPLTIVLNALEFQLSARVINQRVLFGKALEIAVIGSAANMLPLPGAALTRVLGLKAAGGSYRQGATVTGVVALIWLGVALAFSGAAITLLDNAVLGLSFIGIGGVVATIATVMVARTSRNWTLGFLLAIMKVLFVTLDALRIYLCLRGLGVEASYLQASAFVVAGVVGSAVSIVPAGLGVREAVSAGLAPVVGLAASVGFLAASLNRLLGMLVLLPLAVGLAIPLKTTEPLGKDGNTQP